MPKFRSIRPPERQARAVAGRLVNLGALRRDPDRPPSVRTVGSYADCLLQIARHLEAHGLELRDLTPETAVEYLESRAADLSQSALDMHRQALQAMLVHVSRRLPEGGRLTVVHSTKPQRPGGRGYTPQQIEMVAAAQRTRNELSTLIAHAAGLRAHELFTLARPDEQPPDPRPARPEKFAGRPGRDYTVDGKGGLVRLVRIPDNLAERLEACRRDEPVRVTDHGVHHPSRYDVAGGTAWAASFTGASKRALGWTRGAHGTRHAYAQERMRELQRIVPRPVALEVVSQELGHFRPDITETYCV
ncbi:MAG: site-specific integrase [Gammaproteobacteria bacterium]|nr:site-specific integrase [Gammaproteobacteria bacterium]